ncbi:hypothetical protein HDU80_006505 [Chytriomyces hyalinus]|nr:hypothetical protein HDU80_006505 [Chytriomyces hyalinus]
MKPFALCLIVAATLSQALPAWKAGHGRWNPRVDSGNMGDSLHCEYTVKIEGDATCRQVAHWQQITLASFKELNPNLSCRSRIPDGTVVCVPNDPQLDSGKESSESSDSSAPATPLTTFYADLDTLSAETGTAEVRGTGTVAATGTATATRRAFGTVVATTTTGDVSDDEPVTTTTDEWQPTTTEWEQPTETTTGWEQGPAEPTTTEWQEPAETTTGWWQEPAQPVSEWQQPADPITEWQQPPAETTGEWQQPAEPTTEWQQPVGTSGEWQPPVETEWQQPVTTEAPPVEQPPVEQPPVEQPPVEQPPVEQPPVEQPPVEQPPVEQPPVEQPPVEQPAPAPAPPSGGGDSDVGSCIALHNNARAAAGIPPLTWVDDIAYNHAQPVANNCAASGCWNCHEDSGPGTIFAQNMYVSHDSCASAFQGWMDSPGHRDNILDRSYTKFGCGSSGYNAKCSVCDYTW